MLAFSTKSFQRSRPTVETNHEADHKLRILAPRQRWNFCRNNLEERPSSSITSLDRRGRTVAPSRRSVPAAGRDELALGPAAPDQRDGPSRRARRRDPGTPRRPHGRIACARGTGPGPRTTKTRGPRPAADSARCFGDAGRARSHHRIVAGDRLMPYPTETGGQLINRFVAEIH